MWKRVLISFVILLIFILGAGFYFCPLLNHVPTPRGEYRVGYTVVHWDTLTAEMFYPSEPSQGVVKRYPYQPRKVKALSQIKAEESGVPQILWSCLLSSILSFAQPDAVLSHREPSYPVVIYLPGIGGDDLHNTYLEELASHGYIVCALGPPYDTSVTILSDKIVPLDPELKSAIKSNDRAKIYEYRNDAHVRWNKLIDYALFWLYDLNTDKNSPFYTRMDLSNLGLMGHSHGGAVVIDFCQKNKLCKAGINMDGWTKTYNTGTSFDTPFLFLLSESGEMPEMQPLFNANKRTDFKKMTIGGAGHGAFMDYVLLKQPLAYWFGVIRRPHDEVIKSIKDAVVSFFDSYLKDKKDDEQERTYRGSGKVI